MANEIESSALAREIDTLLGPDRWRMPQARELGVARLIVEPVDAAEVAQLVQKCETDRITLAPIGAARSLSQLRPSPVALGVSLTRMDRVVAYEPNDMTVVAEAGLTLGALNREVAAHGQRLPADPPLPDITTLGSLIAAAKAGPLRLNDGTVRDLLIGIRFAGHDGRLVHGGGRVVKNVAGYDLMKVMTGSFGTLGIITEATFKVRPISDNFTLMLADFDHAGAAFEAARRAQAAAPLLHLEVLSAAFGVGFDSPGRLLLIAGFGGSRVEAAAIHGNLASALGANARTLTGSDASAVYERLRDLDGADAAALGAQIAVMPAELGRCLDACGGEFRAHAGCGVAQIFLDSQADAKEIRTAVTRWREIAHSARGHLRILALNPGARGDIDFFDRPAPAAMAVMRRLKAAFDPRGIFNPECFVGGL
jgi:glycolate oxidase FAD binding subunit